MTDHEPLTDRPSVGDYVLATKYHDGDPMDHFCVGFVSGYVKGRFLVVDNNGVSQRANGFRRAERITEDEGRKLVALIPCISDRVGPSLWKHLRGIRGTKMPNHKQLSAEEIADAMERFDDALRRLHAVALRNLGIDLRHAYGAIQDGERALLDLQAKNKRIAELEAALVPLLKLAELYEVSIDGEWGACRDIDGIEADGDLHAEIVAARAAMKGSPVREQGGTR